MLVGERLRRLREERGLSRERLTSQLSLGANQIQRYESGQNDPSGEILAKLATFFEVSTDYLLGLTDQPAPQTLSSSLTAKEVAAILAWRRGERIEAVRMIATDE